MFFHDMNMLERVFWLKRIKGSGNPMHEATSTSGSFVTDVVAPLKKLLVTLEPIQSGSGTPSPDNVRPISGHTEVVTEVCGVNVWDEEWEVGAMDSGTGQNVASPNTIRSKNYISVRGGVAYCRYASENANVWVRIFQYDANKNYISSSAGYTKTSFTTDSNTAFVRFYANAVYGNTYNNDISINYPSTDTSYHAYNGTSHTTPLGRTVYGADVEQVGGVLTDKMAMVDLGTLNWSYYSPNAIFYSSGIRDTAAYVSMTAVANAVCSEYETVMANGYNEGKDSSISIGGAIVSKGVNVKDSRYTDATSFKTAMDGVQLVYELATPQTYQLTRQQINSLIGQNNIITEDGVEVDEIVYMTRLVGSPLLGSPQTEDEPTEEADEPIEETEEPEGE